MPLPGRRPPLLLELDLTQPPAAPEPDDLLSRLQARSRPQLRPVLRAQHDAGRDRRVRGLIVKVGGALPWAVMQELRRGVQAFARTGRPTLAWAESFADSDTAAYVLATAFDEIWLQPGGSVGALGIGLETTFLRGALDKLGIEPQFEQRHEYKNAVDRITRSDFTEAHRASLDALAGSLFAAAVDDIAAGRDLSADAVTGLIDTGPRTAAEALEARLVDRLGYRDEAYAAMRDRVGAEAQLLFADRWKPPRTMPKRHRGHVALVDIHGGIASGRSRRGPMGRQVGSDTVSAALRAALADEHAPAVVLRVDSPGGSAVASEVIWREVERVRAAGKTVVVSMGALAASGGYYVAGPADVVVALPATLTGSIGVFGGKLVTTELLEKLGLTTGSVQRGERALMFSSRRGFDDGERERFAAAIDAIYADFVAKVAAGRGRPVAEIEPLARGRVWSGRDALDVGLVDELGGLRDAVRIARARAGLPDDAPVRPAVRVSPAQRLGRPKNSDDPRAWAHAAPFDAAWARLPGADDLLLRMPGLRLR
ncbi:MAG: signal peptide peptidase SppA [Jatrophihabitans sp.]|uniref:signal peptide peptidase SppA n=1 Tax=Jatrophihabitans sp. TaxID=1932789 RepID=UPI003F7E2352